MRITTLFFLIPCLAVFSCLPSLLAAQGPLQLGPGAPIVRVDRRDAPPCDGALLLNTDGEFENAYAWDDPGVEPPDYGGFADAFTAQGVVCGMRAYLTTLPGYFTDETADAYVYTSDGDNPNVVLSVTPGVSLDPPAHWPEISIHDIGLAPAAVDGEFFLYLWGDFRDGLGWYVAADVRGPVEAKPRTKVAPGIGYPTGWQDVDDIWGATDAMGLGAYVGEDPVPTATSSWGSIKQLYVR